MNKIFLQKLDSSGNVKHVKLLINGKDTGILYLKNEEVEILYECLKNGRIDSETVIETDLFEDDAEDTFADDEYD